MRRREAVRLIRADNIVELKRELCRLEVNVPPRGKGRTADQTEVYSLKLLLQALLDSFDWAFPMEVFHRDRPDFLLSIPNRRIGIEHVEAVSQNEALIASLREQGYGPDVYFTRRSRPGEPVLSREEAIREILADKAGPGWCGDSSEREWAEAIAYFALRKSARMRRPGFGTFDETWLLVYDNWRVPAPDALKCLAAFRARADVTTLVNSLQRLYVVDESHLWELSGCGSVNEIKQRA